MAGPEAVGTTASGGVPEQGDKVARVGVTLFVAAIAAGVTLAVLAPSHGGFVWRVLPVAAVTVMWLAERLLRRRSEADLTEALVRLRRLADGDLDLQDVVLRDRRATALSDASLVLAGRLNGLLSDIELLRGRIAERAIEMNDVAWKMSESAERTVLEASAAASVADGVSQEMVVVASATTQIVGAIREVARHAHDASREAHEGAGEAKAAVETVDRLESASKQVDQIVQLITAIARQTHLLALNATIEAARAAEGSAGFRVVASEVKALAGQTSEATGRVKNRVEDIQNSSREIATVVDAISGRISTLATYQQSIASAVEEQTAATSEISVSTTKAAEGASVLADNVAQLTHVVRQTAYAGARARTMAAELAQVDEALQRLTGGFRFTLTAGTLAHDEALDLPDGTVRVGSTTIVQDYVIGSGPLEFTYTGSWGHATGNVEADGTNAHSSMPGDTAVLDFVGTRIRFYGVGAPNHGRAAVQVDGEAETVVDMYAPTREHGVQYWESPVLARGRHRFTVRVLGECHPSAKYVWTNVDRVEVDD